MTLRSAALAVSVIGLGISTAAPASDDLLHGVAEISAGELHTCAALADGTVACWGRNADGELGNPDAGSYSPYPVQVYKSPKTLLSGVVSVSTAGYFSCALRSTGEVFCWGKIEYGSLGNGTVDPSPHATRVSIAEPV